LRNEGIVDGSGIPGKEWPHVARGDHGPEPCRYDSCLSPDAASHRDRRNAYADGDIRFHVYLYSYPHEYTLAFAYVNRYFHTRAFADFGIYTHSQTNAPTASYSHPFAAPAHATADVYSLTYAYVHRTAEMSIPLS
jgi:hypothetical protein